jgi:hypothetical protein
MRRSGRRVVRRSISTPRTCTHMLDFEPNASRSSLQAARLIHISWGRMPHLTSEGGGQEFDLSGVSRCRANANASHPRKSDLKREPGREPRKRGRISDADLSNDGSYANLTMQRFSYPAIHGRD